MLLSNHYQNTVTGVNGQYLMDAVAHAEVAVKHVLVFAMILHRRTVDLNVSYLTIVDREV